MEKKYKMVEKSAAVVYADKKKVNSILKSCTKKMTRGRRFHGGKSTK